MPKNFNLSAFIITLSVILSGCGTTLYVVPETYHYDNSVSFTIQQIKEMKQTGVGNTIFTPPPGYKVVEIWIDITNHSTATQRVDLEGILLVDNRTQNAYKPQLSLGEGIGGTFGRMQPTISKGNTKSRRLAFAYPKDEKAELLLVNGHTYHLQYTSTPPPSTAITYKDSDE